MFFVSGLLIIVDDEVEFGVVCIDMGGGMIILFVFVDGYMVYFDVIVVGGNYVMIDIVWVFVMCLQDVEWFKIFYGLLLVFSLDDWDMFIVLLLESDSELFNQILCLVLICVVCLCVEEIFEFVRDWFIVFGFVGCVGKQIVLMGGVSQFMGLGEVVCYILGCNVCFGWFLGVVGFLEVVKGLVFVVVVGFLIYL